MLLIADWNDPYSCDDIEKDITWEQEQEWEEIRLRERIAWEQALEQDLEWELKQQWEEIRLRERVADEDSRQ